MTTSLWGCVHETPPIEQVAFVPEMPAGTADLFIDHPLERFKNHRPEWRVAAGDLRIAIPEALVPITGAYVVEARLEGEPEAAIPMDRVLVRAGENVDLLLPPGRYQLRAVRVTIDPSPTD
ncbi:hypothetical protein N9D37_00610 [Erythrobacter sp.]|nr:hypothetical protein [Erythrobacter sp.]